MKKWIIFFTSVLVCGVVFWKWFFNQPCKPPEKPKSVPTEAVWKGDCDGGNWIELVAIEKDKVRFKIFRDWNGDLILDADFEYRDCNKLHLTMENWIEYVAYFGTGIELMNNKEIKQGCRLEPIYPAYFEEKIE